jgi:hypothetical protein
MREEIETEKSLTQLKSFIVREMKSQSADWMGDQDWSQLCKRRRRIQIEKGNACLSLGNFSW